jgi:DNA mismatch repair protein MutL
VSEGAAGRPGLLEGAGSPSPFGVLQAHDSYLVCEVEDGLAIVDQHALHERVQYDRILRRLTEGGVAAQRLLVPEEVEVLAQDRALLEEHSDLLARCGIAWSPFGERSIALESLPAAIPRSRAGELVRDLVELLRARGATVDPRTLFHDVADTMACKAAVRFGDRLGREEVLALLEESGALDKAFVCPHGRPTVWRIPFSELRRKFER